MPMVAHSLVTIVIYVSSWGYLEKVRVEGSSRSFRNKISFEAENPSMKFHYMMRVHVKCMLRGIVFQCFPSPSLILRNWFRYQTWTKIPSRTFRPKTESGLTSGVDQLLAICFVKKKRSDRRGIYPLSDSNE